MYVASANMLCRLSSRRSCQVCPFANFPNLILKLYRELPGLFEAMARLEVPFVEKDTALTVSPSIDMSDSYFVLSAGCANRSDQSSSEIPISILWTNPGSNMSGDSFSAGVQLRRITDRSTRAMPQNDAFPVPLLAAFVPLPVLSHLTAFPAS